MTMKMGLERGLLEKIPDIAEVVQVQPEGPVLTEEGVEEVLEEIRPFLKMVRRRIHPCQRPHTHVLPACPGRAPPATRSLISRLSDSLQSCPPGGWHGRSSLPRCGWSAADSVSLHQWLGRDDQLRPRRDRPAAEAQFPYPRQCHMGLRLAASHGTEVALGRVVK